MPHSVIEDILGGNAWPMIRSYTMHMLTCTFNLLKILASDTVCYHKYCTCSMQNWGVWVLDMLRLHLEVILNANYYCSHQAGNLSFGTKQLVDFTSSCYTYKFTQNILKVETYNYSIECSVYLYLSANFQELKSGPAWPDCGLWSW